MVALGFTLLGIAAFAKGEGAWRNLAGAIVNLMHLESTRRDEASRLFVRIKGHAHELPVSRAYVHLFKAM